MSDFFAPTKNLLTSTSGPYPCRVCGQDRNRMSPLGGFRDQHDKCRRQEQRWHDMSEEIRKNDPRMWVAEQAITDAEGDRDRVYRDAMADLEIPDWFAKQRVASLYDES